jgi:hypothetical protein
MNFDRVYLCRNSLACFHYVNIDLPSLMPEACKTPFGFYKSQTPTKLRKFPQSSDEAITTLRNERNALQSKCLDMESAVTKTTQVCSMLETGVLALEKCMAQSQEASNACVVNSAALRDRQLMIEKEKESIRKEIVQLAAKHDSTVQELTARTQDKTSLTRELDEKSQQVHQRPACFRDFLTVYTRNLAFSLREYPISSIKMESS